MTKEIALNNQILRGVVGSTVHGTNIIGQDDRDEMGIFVEPAFNVCGLESVDHYIYRDKPEGIRSKAGDLDLTLYSLRKFCRLAAQGNPSILLMLWLPEYTIKTENGERLINIRCAFVSKKSGERFLGYLLSQKLSLTGQRKKNVVRQDLIDKYGFDTKYASHALRLAYQGIEYLNHGRITLPVPTAQLITLRGVRTGEFSFSDTLSLINDAEVGLKNALNTCVKKVNYQLINETMVRIHKDSWEKKGEKKC